MAGHQITYIGKKEDYINSLKTEIKLKGNQPVQDMFDNCKIKELTNMTSKLSREN